jgi:Zn-finger nucleic acid-binding protein
MTERQGVEIDYCTKCRGVWLDRGELDKIIERTAGDARTDQPAHRPASSDYEDREYRTPEYRHDPRYKKKKSFLGDLFDFD